jgi:hypothetical protein
LPGRGWWRSDAVASASGAPHPGDYPDVREDWLAA